MAHFHSLGRDDRDALGEVGPVALRHHAYSLFQVGRFAEAQRIVDLAISAAGRPWSRNYTLVYGLGLSAFEGRVPAARATASLIDPDKWPHDHAHSYMNALGRIGQATLLLDDFDFDGALAQFDDCEAFLHTAEFWPLINWVFAHARLGLGAVGTETHRLHEAVFAAQPPPGIGDSVATAALLNILAISWFAAGNRKQALDVLKQRQTHNGQLAPAEALSRMTTGNPDAVLRDLPALEARTGHTVRSTLATLTVAAAAAVQTERAEVAATLLRRIAALHECHGPRLQLMYLSSDDLAALRAFASDLGEPAAVAHFAGRVSPGIARWQLVEPATAALSRREQIVLEAMLRFDSRADLAEALHVSEHTVKSQLRSIYKKLGVNNRDAAIERAITLGLFGDRRRELR
ncbi:response regulator transcription factor [Nocardioides caeni]|uniref:Response regulator transcription factor n=2 Tax=Nocardioides caeni TaxID=574700 RepID=A0A4S8N3F7_9ACTN|nr:response regulator transcription factor [Nocardioides caeni]